MQLDLLDLQLAASIRGDLDEAWRLSEILAREQPHNHRAAFNRGWHLFRRGDFKGGMALTERGRIEGVFGSKHLNTHKPRWTGEDLAGKTILLRGEGGFGDEIVGARFAQLLAARGAKVIASASYGIAPVIARAKGVAQAIVRGKAEEEAQYDYWLPAMSAPIPLDMDYSTVPSDSYLSPNPVYVEKWRKILSPSTSLGTTLRVGIRWSGNPGFEHEQHRRFPVEPLFALAEIPGVQLYSLQRDHDLRDLPPGIVDLQDEIETWEDTAAAIANLDLVITSCTAIAHLSAAMGKETWIIIPVLPYYLWAMPGEHSPWYGSVRLFRQEVFGNWDAPLAKVRGALEERMTKTAQVRPAHDTRQASIVATAPLEQKPLDVARGKPLYSREAMLASYAVAGIYITPYQSKHDTGQTPFRHCSKNTLHFVGGLPRSGSTALISLLAQNSRIHGAPISGLASMFSGIHLNWDKSDFHQELPNPAAKKRVLRALLEHYHETDRPLILDKDRHWMAQMDLLEEVLERPIKMLVPVRPMPEVVASFEALYRKNPLAMQGPDEALGANSTIATRAAYFAGNNGPIGLAYNAMKDAVTRGYLDRMLFIDYNKLMSAPKMQLRRIYEFLEEPYFEHNLHHVEQAAKSDWRPHKLPGLHDVRTEFKKDYKPARQILGDVYGLYDLPEPWRSWT